jgi:tetratricopeptide (TPR) repeat protein
MSEDKPRYELHFHAGVQNVDDNSIVTIVQDNLTESIIQPLYRLPPNISQFTGRQVELEQVTTYLRRTHETKMALAVLTGIAGVGKSAIAIHAAYQLKPDFPDAQLYINLRGTESQPTEPFQVLASFIRALAENDQPLPETLTERTNLYRSLLSKKRAIIILDNAYNEAQIRPLLPLNCACAVIITTRQEMASEAAATLEIEAMREPDALKLLEYWVGSDRIFAEPEAAKTIINLCRKLPLAICIIGGIFTDKPDWQLEDCAQKLSLERQRLLSLRLSDLVTRASISLSYQELAENTARLFRLLALLTGTTFSGAIAAALLECDKTSAIASLDQLVDQQLIEIVSVDRYRFHDLVRLFAKGQLAKEEPTLSRQAARLRISRWYLETAQIMDLALNSDNYHKFSSALKSTDTAQNLAITALNWFELEQTNLLAALKWAHQVKDWEIVVSLATNLVNFFNLYGSWDDWQQTQEMAWEAIQVLEQLTDNSLAQQELHFKKAQILANLGNVYSLKSDWQKASESYQLSLSLFEELGNRLGVAKTLGNWANVESRQGEWQKANVAYQQSLSIFSELKDNESEGQTLANFGILWAQQNQTEKAAELWQEALVKLPKDLPKAKRISQWLNLMKPVVEMHNQEIAQLTTETLPAISQATAQLKTEAPSAIEPTTPKQNMIIVLGIIVIIAIACCVIFFS